MKSWAWATSQARCTSSSDAFSTPYVTLLLIIREGGTVSKQKRGEKRRGEQRSKPNRGGEEDGFLRNQTDIAVKPRLKGQGAHRRNKSETTKKHEEKREKAGERAQRRQTGSSCRMSTPSMVSMPLPTS
jgi:hypothetical protein